MYVMIRVHPAVWLAILLDKDLSVGHTDFVLPAMHIGTIDFCHFIPLSLTLTLAGGHKVGAKQNLLASFSCTLYLISMKFGLYSGIF